MTTNQPTYTVTDREGRQIKQGDIVVDFRGTAWTFIQVTRGVEYNGTAKVEVDGGEFYAGVFGLRVATNPPVMTDQDELAMLREFVDEVTRILDDQINGHLTAYDATVAIAQELVNIQRSNA